MIIIRFHGGLGNQMFQYVFYEYMKKKYQVPVKADLTWFDRNFREHQGYELEKIFGIRLDKASYKEVAMVHEYYPKYYAFAGFRYLARKNAARKNRRLHNEDNYIFDFGPSQYTKNERFDALDAAKDWYIEGVFCSDEYLKPYEKEFRQKLQFLPPVGEKNRKLMEKMKNCESVAIHVRRGDYVGNVFDILGTGYYKRAVEAIGSKVNNPVFYVFSDDMDYIRQEFTFLKNYVPVHNEGKNSYMDMQLIGACKHAIIANSSFSYWGALLGEEEGSIIVAPAKYKADEDLALARDGWVLIEP